MRRLRHWALSLLLFCSSVASAATIHSNSGENLEWSSSSTWDGEVVPGSGDDVVIGPGSHVVIGSETVATAASVSISAGQSSGNEPASLLVAGTLTITNALAVIGGTPSVEPATGGSAMLTVFGTVMAGSVQITGGAGSSFGAGGEAGIWIEDDAALLKSAGNVSLSSQVSAFDDGAPALKWTWPLSGEIDVDGNLTGTSAASLWMGEGGSSQGILRLAGGFQWEGSFTPASGKVYLDGTSHQLWSGPATFHDLVISNSSSSQFQTHAVTFDASSVEIAGTLYMAGGSIAAPEVNLDSATGLTYTSGYVDGILTRSVLAGIDTGFPVGTWTFFAPVNLTPFSGGILSVKAEAGRPPGAGPLSLEQSWLIQGTPDSLTDIEFNYVETNVAGDESLYVAGHYDNSQTWQRFPGTADTVNNIFTVAGTLPTSGTWTLGEASSLTTATHFVVASINEGQPLHANTPFDIVLEARDENEDPAVFNDSESWTIQLGSTPTPSGTFGRLYDMQAPVNFFIEPGTSSVRIDNLVYTAAEEVSLELLMSVVVTASSPITHSHHDPTSFNVTFLPPAPALSVSSTADAGYGTLRRTIETANIGGCSASPCPIGFDLPLSEQGFDGIWRITLQSGNNIQNAGGISSQNFETQSFGFPGFTTAVILDATTQPGYAGTPVVEIDGGGHGFVVSFEGPPSIVRGFALHNAHTTVNLEGAGGHKVEACYLGIHADGTVPNSGAGNTTLGVYSERNSNIVGGPLPENGNVISGCQSAGVMFAFGALDNVVANNSIGLTPPGTAAAPNATGVLISGASRTAVTNNRIAGNSLYGVHITGTAVNAKENHFEGNTIGLGTGGESLPHSLAGIMIEGQLATQNIVGGPALSQRNVIAETSGDGVVVTGNALAAAILNNDIRSSGGLRIDLDGDGAPSVNDPGDSDVNGDPGVSGNNGQNKPVISSSKLYGTELRTIVSVDSAAVNTTLSMSVEIFKVTPLGGTLLLTSGCFDTNFIDSLPMDAPGAPVVEGDSVVATVTSFSATGCNINSGSTYYINDGTSEYSSAVAVTTCTTTTPTIDPPPTVNFCGAPFITLQSSSGDSYQWLLNGSPIGGANAQTYDAIVPGDYSVIVTDAFGCPAESAPITLSAGTLPDAPTITPDGTTSFCSGSVTLTSSVGNSYLWKKDGVNIPDATSQSYVATTSGSYTVVITNGDGCSAESDPVIVDAAASAEVPTIQANGPTTFCDPGSVILTASTGVSWQWYRNDVLLPSETLQSIEVTTSGNYKVVATDEGACSAASAPMTVTVNTVVAAIISPGHSFCPDESVLLTASSGASWQWYFNDSPIGGATSQSYYASVAGEYMVFVTGTNGCSAYSSPRMITEAVPTTPTISHTDPTTFCDGGSVQLLSSAAPSYQWLRNDVVIPGATFQTYVATTSGSYSVATLDGCAVASAPVVVTVHPVPDAEITAPTNIVAESSANASVPDQSGASYAWTISGGTILSSPAGSTITFRAGIVGEVSLSVTVTREGCTSSSTHEVNITATADLSLKKSGPASVSAGEMIAFKLIVSNAGPNIAANVVLQDPLPPGTSFISATGTMSCDHSNGLVTCSTPQIASGASASVDLFVTSPLVATLVSNTASVASAGNDPLPADNSSTAEVSVIGTPGGCALVPPVLLSPAGGAVTASPVAFSWTPVTGAVAYEVWVISGGVLTLAGSTSATSLQAELSSGASSWFVVVRLGTGCDPLTTSESPFTVSQREYCPVAALPQIINPPTGSQLSSPVLIMWTPASEAVGYRVWMSVNGAAPEDLGATSGATSLIANLPPGKITLYVDALFGGCPPARSGGVVVTIPGEDPCGNRGVATPMTPADDTTQLTSAASLGWNTAPNADGYRVWASVDGGIPMVVGSTNESTVEAMLPAGEIFWWVESLYDGCMSTESQQSRLLIPPATSCGTSLPHPLFPSAGSTVATADVTFSWSSVADALAYEVWLAMENGVPVLIGTTSSTSLTRHVPAGDFEWFVRALPDRCPARDSSTLRFTRTLPAGCDALARPSTIAPGDGDRFVSSATFRWLPAEGASHYEIFVIRTGAPELVLSTTATTIEGIPLPIAKYRWFVRAHAGESCWLDSEEQHFEVTTTPASCGILPAPMIATPAEISSSVPFPIQWTAIAGAAGYQLQIASHALFQGAELVTSSATHHEVVKVNESGVPVVIYARVRAVDTRCTPPATSPYSPTAAIFILPPQLPGGAAPSTGGIVTYTIELGPELAGQSFAAVPDKSFLTVSPASGVVAAGGTILTVVADTSSLPLGMTLGGVLVTLSSSAAGPAVSHATTSLSSLFSINLVTPISPTTKNTPPPDALIIPAVAHADGIDSHFQSDVRVSNTSPQLMKYQLTFTASGDAGMTQGRQTTFSIEPGQTIALDDILKTWFGTANTNTTGSLEIRPLTPIASSLSSATVGSVANLVTFASSRTYNLTPNGTFGQFIPAVPYANFIGKATAGGASRILSLQQIAQSTKYRTNLGIVEASGDPASLLVRVFGSSGQQLSEFPVSLKGGQHTQLNSFISAQGLGTVSDGRIEVEVVSTTGKVTAYASVLDNETSDPLLVTPVLLSDNGSTRWVVPGVADIDTGAANWQTDMRVFNPGDTAVHTTFSFYSQSGGPARTASLTIPPGEVRQLDRIVSSLFGASQDGGSIHVDTLQPERLIATARTYNQTSSGTYGQFISAITPADAIGAGSRPLQLLQIEESERYRTNVGLAEVLGKPAVIEVSVIPPDGKFSAVVTIPMGPNEFRQIGSLLRSVGLQNTHNARVTVRVIQGEGLVTAYASVVDMETNDPTYVPAQ